MKLAAASSTPFKVYLQQRQNAAVIIIIPLGYRGPVLVRDRGKIEHTHDQQFFKFKANVSGITDLPASPPILDSLDVSMLGAEWSDGRELPHIAPLDYLERKTRSNLGDEQIAWRAIESGMYDFGVYVVGTRAEARQYAADHGLLNDGDHAA